MVGMGHIKVHSLGHEDMSACMLCLIICAHACFYAQGQVNKCTHGVGLL